MSSLLSQVTNGHGPLFGPPLDWPEKKAHVPLLLFTCYMGALPEGAPHPSALTGSHGLAISLDLHLPSQILIATALESHHICLGTTACQLSFDKMCHVAPNPSDPNTEKQNSQGAGDITQMVNACHANLMACLILRVHIKSGDHGMPCNPRTPLAR